MSETTSRFWADPGAADGEPGAELDRAAGTGRVELDDPEVAAAEVGVEPPAEALVELLRPVDIRDGDDDGLELHVDGGVSAHGSS